MADHSNVEPLPDEAVVIRGGVMNLADLRLTAEAHHEAMKQHGVDEWALSINSIPGLTASQIARRARLFYGMICISTVGRIRGTGCDVHSDGRQDGHGNIVFAAQPGDTDLVRVRAVFDEPVRNPYPRVRRRR